MSRRSPLPDARVHIWLAWTSVIMAAPVLLFRWAPISDLADFELVLAGLRAYGDPVHFPESVYRLQLGGANQLVFALGYPLAAVLGADLGARALAALVLAMMPWAVAHAALTFDRSRYAAVALGPLALGAAFRLGLLGFLFAVALALAALRPLEALARDPTPRRAAVASAWATLATLAHGAAPVLLALVALPWILRRRRAPREAAWIAASLVPSIGLLFAQVRLLDRNANAAFRALADLEHPRLLRFAALADNLVGPYDDATAVALCAAVACALWLLRRGAPPVPDTRARLATAAIVLAQYWIWPYGHNGAGLLYLRFLLPGAVLLGLALAPRPHRPGALAVAGLAAVPVALTLPMLPLYQACQAAHAALDRLAPLVAEGSAIACVDFRTPGSTPLGDTARPAAHLIARRGGRTWAFPDAPQEPLRVRDACSWPSGIRLMNANNLVPEVDLARYRYLLVVTPDARFVQPLAVALGPCARGVAYAEPYALFESRCLRYPIDAPEPPLPPDRPRTVGWRLWHPGASPTRSGAP